MSDTSITTSHAIAAEQFNDYAFREYVQKIVLKPYMGMSSESVVQVQEILSKAKGDAVTFNLARALSGAGKVSGETMEGSEEAMNFYGHRITLEEYRNAVKDDGTLSRQRTPFELQEEFRPALTTWMAQKLEDKCFEALASISGTVYGSADTTAKNAWNVAQSDRILFGAATSNYSATHATALATIDTSNDQLTTAQISLAKRLAQLSNPIVRPVKIENGEEYYVMFVHNYCARDLKNSDAWKNAQQYARERGLDNPIFTGMLGVWDGVILKETPKCKIITGVGASSSNVAINYLCGAQALLYCQSSYPENGNSKVVLTEKRFDYDVQQGMQIKSIWAHAKAEFNSKQHGVVSVFSSAVTD